MKKIDYDRLEMILNREFKEKLLSNDKTITIDYELIEEYYPQLANALHEDYYTISKTLERHMENMRIQKNETEIRFKNVKPVITLDQIHQKYNSKWISFEGIVKKRSTVYNQIKEVHWTCKECGNDYVFQLEYNDKLISPNENCRRCGRKTGYELNRNDSKYEDIQLFILEEEQKNARSVFQPTQLKCYLKDEMINAIKPGDKIRANGIVELQNIGKNNHFQEYVTITEIEKLEKNFEDINISQNEEETIRKLAENENIYSMITESIIPSIYGYDELKLALALHLFSSPHYVTHDGSYKRGDIHILLIGDPSMGKSQILKYVSKLAPHGIYTSGKGSSGTGLTATTVKDEQGNWSLEAGAMVLANDGNICIDEFDKMKEDDRSAIHEALEQQTISISKAGINTTLNSRCSVLAAANPKYGRFDMYKNMSEQLNLSPAILSRFDLIFVLTDNIDKKEDTRIAMKILEHRNNCEKHIDEDVLKKYISLARTLDPKLDEGVKGYITKFFCECRSLAKENHHPIPITARQLEAIVRLSKASSRIRLSNKVTLDDAKRAINLQRYCMKQVGFDSQTSSLEADKVTGNMTLEERQKMQEIEEEIYRLKEEWENSIPQHILFNHLQIMGFPKEKVRKYIKENLEKRIYFDEVNNRYSVI